MNRVLYTVILWCFLITICPHHTEGHELIAPVIEQDGELYSFEHIFTKSLPLKFSLNNDINGKWRVMLRNIAGTLNKYEVQVSTHKAFIFYPDIIPSEDWHKAQRIYEPSLNRDLFEFYISFETEAGIIDEKLVKLGYLPSYPIISNVKFNYTYDWDTDDIYPNGDFSFHVHSDGATRFIMAFTDSFLFDHDRKLFKFSYDFRSIDEIDISYDADWGEYIQVVPSNKFGYIMKGDTICTTSYITDPDILTRIEEIRQKSDIKSVTENRQLDYNWNNHLLEFNKPVAHLKLYNLNGILVNEYYDVTSIDLSFISPGILIVSAETKNPNTVHNLKIVKR